MKVFVIIINWYQRASCEDYKNGSVFSITQSMDIFRDPIKTTSAVSRISADFKILQTQ
jgi:hypothetical protein